MGRAGVSFALATAVAALSCGRNVELDQAQHRRGEAGFKVEAVDLRAAEGSLFVNYSTSTSLTDCNAQRAEMAAVWDAVVKPRLTGAVVVKTVFLVPEDHSGRSVGFAFDRDAAGGWKSFAPCRLSIPER